MNEEERWLLFADVPRPPSLRYPQFVVAGTGSLPEPPSKE